VRPPPADAAALAGSERFPITVIVPVRNEEANLPACLASLDGFAAVIVVDSQSTDRTVEIAHAAGARVAQFHWQGGYPKKRNWALDQLDIPTDWVLFLDADEVLTPAFRAALHRRFDPAREAGYWLHYTVHFMGRALRHGVPARKLALFRKQFRYERIEDLGWTKLDMEVHEHPIVEGPVGNIAEPIDHRDDRGVAHLLRRHVDYAAWEVARAQALQSSAGTDVALTPRQQRKYRWLGACWFPAAYFLLQYVVRLGFLDGLPGYRYACMKHWYFATIRLLMIEDRRGRQSAKGASA
jgi:hypothetical protein